MEVYGDAQIVRVQYNTPYVRNLSITLHLTETDADAAAITRTLHPGWSDSFVAEWRAFYDSVQFGTPAKTDVADFRQDLVLFAQIMAQLG